MKMKNKFWLTVCFLAIFSLAKAEKSATHVHFMLFGGFNSSKTVTDLKTKQAIISDAKLNYNFGAGFRFEFGPFFLQPEVYFTRKGGLENSFRSNERDSIGQHVDMQSVDMPIMFGLRLFHSEGFCLRAYGGPVISYLKDQKLDINKNGQLIPWSELNARARAFSMQIGVGLDITRRFTFDVRYEYAFSPMFKISDFKTSYRITYFTLGIKLF
jgi:opacity protein-like surface antigen